VAGSCEYGNEPPASIKGEAEGLLGFQKGLCSVGLVC
jgi:hypothetical protein